MLNSFGLPGLIDVLWRIWRDESTHASTSCPSVRPKLEETGPVEQQPGLPVELDWTEELEWSWRDRRSILSGRVLWPVLWGAGQKNQLIQCFSGHLVLESGHLALPSWSAVKEKDTSSACMPKFAWLQALLRCWLVLEEWEWLDHRSMRRRDRPVSVLFAHGGTGELRACKAVQLQNGSEALKDACLQVSWDREVGGRAQGRESMWWMKNAHGTTQRQHVFLEDQRREEMGQGTKSFMHHVYGLHWRQDPILKNTWLLQ